jgi:hypothetical protein
MPTTAKAETSPPDMMSVADFCARHAISKSYFYKLRAQGMAPQSGLIGRKRLISADAAEAWRRNLMEGKGK